VGRWLHSAVRQASCAHARVVRPGGLVAVSTAAARRSQPGWLARGVVVVNGRLAGRSRGPLPGLPGPSGQVFGFIGGVVHEARHVLAEG